MVIDYPFDFERKDLYLSHWRELLGASTIIRKLKNRAFEAPTTL